MTADHPTLSGDPAREAGGVAADPQVLALARAVDRTGRKVGALDTQVCQLGADVARVIAVVADIHRPGPYAAPHGDRPDDGDPEPDGPPAVRSWLLAADPAQAAADLTDLVGWLDRVYLRYPGVELAPCWLWHPHVIEELWWLRRAHAEAYHREDGSWLRVGDWHDRQRPAVAKRVREAIGGCDLTLHTDGQRHGHAPQVAPLAAHAAQIAAAWSTASTRPSPTPGQLDEAAAYTEALYRTQR